MNRYICLHPNKMAGDNVHVALASTFAGSTSVALGIFDANLQPRTLKATERLVLDDLVCDLSTGTVDLLGVAAGASSTNVASSTLLASFNTAVGDWHTDGEGLSCPVGVTPSVLPSSSTAVVKISGSGRIMEATTAGVRPPWREATVRGD